MADEWHYAKDGNQHGPVSASELKQLAASGTLATGDLVWKEGMDEWKPASKVKGLFFKSELTSPDSLQSVPAAAPPALPQKPESAVENWHYSIGGNQNGPVSFEELKRLAAADQLGPSDLIWREGDSDWQLASAVDGLLPDKPKTSKAEPPPLSPASAQPASPTASPGGWFKKAHQWVGWKINAPHFPGRWISVDDQSLWMEFFQGNEFRHSDGTTGKWDVLDEGKYLDIVVPDGTVHRYTILNFQGGIGGTLQIQDQNGSALSFKKGKTLAQQEVGKAFSKLNPFAVNRAELLVSVWQHATNEQQWFQFTDDGAFIASHGPAGRYTFSGENPNEVIEITLADESTKTWKIVSLSATQLVFAEDGDTTILRKSGAKTSAGNRAKSHGTPEPEKQASRTKKGFFGQLFSTSDSCPECGSKNTESAEIELSSVVSDRPAMRKHDRVQCDDCGYWWLRLGKECPECGTKAFIIVEIRKVQDLGQKVKSVKSRTDYPSFRIVNGRKYTLSGEEILDPEQKVHNGFIMYYRDRCEKCGHESERTVEQWRVA